MKLVKSWVFWYLVVLLCLPLVLLASDPATQPSNADPGDPDGRMTMSFSDQEDVKIQLPDGRTVSLAELRANGGAGLVMVRSTGDGVRSIEIHEDDREISINESPDEIVVQIKEGEAEPVEYRAADAEELEEEHPEAFEVYQRYAKDLEAQLPPHGADGFERRIEVRLDGTGRAMGGRMPMLRAGGTKVESLGITCHPALDGFVQAQLGEGVAVLSVDEDSPAAELGLKQHDFIKSAAGKPVRTADELDEAVLDSGNDLQLEVIRGGKPLTLPE